MVTQPSDTTRSSWHDKPADEVFQALESSRDGLTTAEAKGRLEKTGPNLLPRDAGPGVLHLLWRQVNNPLIYVLLGAAVLALVMGKILDGIVVLAVVVLNMLIGFVQEFRAGRAIQGLIDLVPENALALRDSRQVTLPAAELVPGDVVLLQAGDKVPADMRLFSVRNLQVEEAALTGESVPAAKGTGAVEAAAGLGDRRGMVYSGTMVTAGTGAAVVVETGDRTELGRISSMMREATEVETPLTQQIAKVGKALTVAIMLVALLLFGIGLVRGYTLIDAVLAAITLAVAAIPEGLPAIITIALAIGVQRMAHRQAVIRKLPAVETLGSTTVICSDKTGTLTRGEMTIQALWTPQTGRFDLSGAGYIPEGSLSKNGTPVEERPEELETLLTAGVLCSDATLRHEDASWYISGDPTEGALVVAAEKLGMQALEQRKAWRRLDTVPFESERQYMATLHARPDGGGVIYMKGAPEVVVGRCSPAETGPEDARRVLGEVERLADEGMRVLAFAAKSLPDDRAELQEADLEEGFTLLGLQAMIDPPRPEAVEAIKACHAAGIEVKMITGDHQATARAIGRQLGLLQEADRVHTGRELETLSDEALQEEARRTGVFARVAPEHKLRLVRSLQTRRQVVAMTGDGVNDAPALKQADIGIAMGITGTAASKESADMVLADDNFASIAAAVEEGRRVYDNLIKSLAFVLPTNIGEALIILFAVLWFPIVGGTFLMPMLPVQILWINLVATVALALPLAFEAMEPSVMRRPPRMPDAPLLSRFVVFRTIVVALLMTAGSLGLFLYEYDVQLAEGAAAALALRRAQTVAVTTVILFQIFYLIQCRSLKHSALKIGLWSNPWIYAGIAALLVLQVGFVYVPFMHTLFGSAPLDADAWLKAVLAALLVLPLISAEKWWRSRQDRTAGDAAMRLPGKARQEADAKPPAEKKTARQTVYISE